MDLRLTFNSDPDNYDLFRQTYTAELFTDLIKLSKLKKETQILEIGIGTGQATKAFLDYKCDVTAIEIGSELTKFTQNKFSEYKNLSIINDDFEKVKLEEDTYELIYSASAFHWIPLDFGMKKVLSLLKDGGSFAWFSTTPLASEENIEIYNDIQNIYIKYSEYFNDSKEKRNLEDMKKQVDEKLNKREEIFRRYSFIDVQKKTYFTRRSFKADEYIKMISTHSDHKAIPEKTREIFLSEIENVINKHGGEFILKDKIILCMGKKKAKS